MATLRKNAIESAAFLPKECVMKRLSLRTFDSLCLHYSALCLHKIVSVECIFLYKSEFQWQEQRDAPDITAEAVIDDSMWVK